MMISRIRLAWSLFISQVGMIGWAPEVIWTERPVANLQGGTIQVVCGTLRESVELVSAANRRRALKTLDPSRIIREPIVVSAK